MAKAGTAEAPSLPRSTTKRRESWHQSPRSFTSRFPPTNVDRFFAFWQDSVKDKVNKQPGLIDGIFHRGIDPDGPFQFINVARWESAEQLESGLRATGEELHQEGVEMGKVFQDLGVKVSQNNYAEAVRYTAIADSTRTV